VKKTHIFLTGERGVGKSTAIGKLTDRLVSLGLDVGGFKTLAGPEDESGCDAVYIMPYGENTKLASAFSRDRMVAIRNRRASKYESYADVFDGLGAELLRRAARCDLIIMDEIGFMEADAIGFQNAVLSVLGGATPVLGVVKPPSASKNLHFLDGVRFHEKVRVFTVRPENRDETPDMLFDFFIKS
jgi:nucleoside-triphosphatase THEP1